MIDVLPQKLIFVHGKGGVGRTTFATALGMSFAARGERSLVVQWSLRDGIAPAFGFSPCNHEQVEVSPLLSVMNFDGDQALREYVVDYLGMPSLFHFVLQNRHVGRLVHGVPGIQELLFVGRLYWLVHLAEKSGRIPFQRIIVDSPATGHGLSLINLPKMVSTIGIAGPVVNECERVLAMLRDPHVTADAIVTLAEELVVEETLEFLPQLESVTGRRVSLVVLNRSVGHLISWSPEVPPWLQMACDGLHNPGLGDGLKAFYADVARRAHYESVIRERLAERMRVPLVVIPDAFFLSAQMGTSACFRLATESVGSFLSGRKPASNEESGYGSHI